MKSLWIRFLGVFGIIFLFFGVLTLFLAAAAQEASLQITAYIEIGLGLICLVTYLANFFTEATKSLSRNKEAIFGLAGGGLLLALLIGVNIVANSELGEKKFDTTVNKIHSLSQSSREILEGLTHEIEIYSFVVDPRARPLLTNLVDKYQYYSDKIKFQLLDPDSDPARLEAYDAEIGDIILLNPESEKTVKINASQINEQDFTTAIRRVLTGETKTLYFVQSNGEPSIDDDQSQAGMYLARFLLEREGYTVKPLDLNDSGQGLPSDADIVVAWGAEQTVPEASSKLLQDYLNRGGTLMIGQNPVISQDRRSIAQSGYESLIRDYGLEFGQSILLQRLNLGGRSLQVSSIQTNEFSSNPLVQDLEGSVIQFTTVQPVRQLEAYKGQATRSQLISTTPQIEEINDISKIFQRRQTAQFVEGVAGPHPIAQSVERQVAEGVENKISNQSRLIVFGGAKFANNNFINSANNADLFLNIFAGLLGRPEAISIRERTWKTSTLEINDEVKPLIYFASILAIPQLIILLGMGIWMYRRSRL